MSTLILYMSHHGTTHNVVEYLKNKLGHGTHSFNLEKHGVPELSAYDTVIVGGSIHIGQIQPGVKRFCELHKDELLTKRLGLFICFMNKELGLEEFRNAFSRELRDHAHAHGLFGGELLVDKMSFMEKFIVRMVRKQNQSQSQLDYPAIEKFIGAFL
jgi:menaquinone-dependent protoporphyrinogen oxidase